MGHDNIVYLVDRLRDCRVKLNCDYSYTYKYNELHILSHYLFEDTIREVAADIGLPIKQILTYR